MRNILHAFNHLFAGAIWTSHQSSLLLRDLQLVIGHWCWLEWRSTHGHSPVEETLGHWGEHVQSCAPGTSAVPSDSHEVWVSTEDSYVSLDPAEGLHLVLQTKIPRSPFVTCCGES